MKKELIKKIIDFYNKDNTIIYYLLANDDFQGLIEIDIQEDDGGDYPVFVSRSSHPRAQEYKYLHECDISDFKFYKKVDILKE